MNKAIIIIPEKVDEKNQVEITTNGIHLAQIVNSVHNLYRGLCQQLVKEAETMVGSDPKKQEKYLDDMIDNHVKSKDAKFKGNDLLSEN